VFVGGEGKTCKNPLKREKGQGGAGRIKERSPPEKQRNFRRLLEIMVNHQAEERGKEEANIPNRNRLTMYK